MGEMEYLFRNENLGGVLTSRWWGTSIFFREVLVFDGTYSSNPPRVINSKWPLSEGIKSLAVYLLE